MMDCLILGDSIAVGIAAHTAKCRSQAAVGMASGHLTPTISWPAADTVVISIGSNDSNMRMLTENLQRIRAATVASRIVWILPAHRMQADTVAAFAGRYGDTTITIPQLEPDGIHPTQRAYQLIARAIQ